MISEHDRERILAVAEEFYKMLAEDPPESVEDVTLDHFVIVGVMSVVNDDASEAEVPVMYSSSRRTHVQRGILEAMLDEMKSTSISIKFAKPTDDEEEEDNGGA